MRGLAEPTAAVLTYLLGAVAGAVVRGEWRRSHRTSAASRGPLRAPGAGSVPGPDSGAVHVAPIRPIPTRGLQRALLPPRPRRRPLTSTFCVADPAWSRRCPRQSSRLSGRRRCRAAANAVDDRCEPDRGASMALSPTARRVSQAGRRRPRHGARSAGAAMAGDGFVQVTGGVAVARDRRRRRQHRRAALAQLGNWDVAIEFGARLACCRPFPTAHRYTMLRVVAPVDAGTTAGWVDTASASAGPSCARSPRRVEQPAPGAPRIDATRFDARFAVTHAGAAAPRRRHADLGGDRVMHAAWGARRVVRRVTPNDVAKDHVIVGAGTPRALWRARPGRRRREQNDGAAVAN